MNSNVLSDAEPGNSFVIVQGHRNQDISSLVHRYFVSKLHSMTMLIGISTMFRFRMFSSDITQAHLPSAEAL